MQTRPRVHTAPPRAQACHGDTNHLHVTNYLTTLVLAYSSVGVLAIATQVYTQHGTRSSEHSRHFKQVHLQPQAWLCGLQCKNPMRTIYLAVGCQPQA